MTGVVVIGLMSGTSVDGIDAAVLKTDGQNFQALGCPSVYDYRDETRDAIWTAVANPNALMRDESMRVNLDRLIAEDHARAVLKLIDADGFNPVLIGFHGQTIYHNPAGQIEHPLGRGTIQLGDASLLAQITNLPVVYDVRSADMAAGGEGAPLAPVFHAAVLGRLNVGLPAVLVNVGGIANLTWFDRISNTGFFIIFGIFNRAKKCGWPTCNQECQTFFWPAKGWWQFGAILNTNTCRCARSGINKSSTRIC